MQPVITWLIENWATVATILFLLSEILAYIPGVKSNSVFQVICTWLAKFAPKT